MGPRFEDLRALLRSLWEHLLDLAGFLLYGPGLLSRMAARFG